MTWITRKAGISIIRHKNRPWKVEISDGWTWTFTSLSSTFDQRLKTLINFRGSYLRIKVLHFDWDLRT